MFWTGFMAGAAVSLAMAALIVARYLNEVLRSDPKGR